MAKSIYVHVKVPKSLSTKDIRTIRSELENFLAIEPNELIDAYKLVYGKGHPTNITTCQKPNRFCFLCSSRASHQPVPVWVQVGPWPPGLERLLIPW